jgi:hypothetical protein
VGDLVAVAMQEHAERTRVVVRGRRREDRHPVVVRHLVADDGVACGAAAEEHGRHVAGQQVALDAVVAAEDVDGGERALLGTQVPRHEERRLDDDAVAGDDGPVARPIGADGDGSSSRAALRQLQPPAPAPAAPEQHPVAGLEIRGGRLGERSPRG